MNNKKNLFHCLLLLTKFVWHLYDRNAGPRLHPPKFIDSTVTRSAPRPRGNIRPRNAIVPSATLTNVESRHVPRVNHVHQSPTPTLPERHYVARPHLPTVSRVCSASVPSRELPSTRSLRSGCRVVLVALDGRVPLLLVKLPAGLELVDDLLARLWQ